MFNTFMTDSSLDSLIFDKRVLFVNGIRSDLPSGGNTATQTLLRYLTMRCKVEIFSMAPDRNLESKTAFAIKSFPAGALIALYRFWRRRWLEFFARFSPWLLVSMLFKYFLYKPDVLIFNHHCTFLFSYFFLSKKILVWHDVPSTKVSKRSDRHLLDKYLCTHLERSFLKSATQSWILSFTDQKFLRRFYAHNSCIFPALDSSPNLPRKNIERNSWLLIGNWSRIENCSGAIDFFLAYVQLARVVNNDLRGSFIIAGAGSSIFLENLLQLDPNLHILEIQALNHFNDLSQFSQSALLAPIKEGAGIKLKTLEAWSCDIPVIGTTQAFSGLPLRLWEMGGIKLDTSYDIAKFCIDWTRNESQLAKLSPLTAYISYHTQFF